MAKARVKNTKKVADSVVKKFDAKLKRNIARAPKDEIENEIIITILSGQSPVSGKKFKPYNEQYAKRFKDNQRVPVDMLRTGKMLKSLSVSQKRGDTALVIEFNSRIAVYHDIEGAGVNQIKRRLLPRGKETFKRSIQILINKLIRRAISDSTQ